MARFVLLLLFVLLALPVRAAELTPILMANGELKMTCDGEFHHMHSTPLNGKQVVATYLFGNLVTNPSAGADVVLWSPSYGSAYIEPYPNGPASMWGPLGDLHIYSQPNGHTGGRQGESYRSFQPDGVTINDYVEVVAKCWGGGTLETYAVLYVRDPQP